MRWGGIFDYDSKLLQLKEEELKTQDPDFWLNPQEAEKQMKTIKSIKEWTTGFENINRAIEDFTVLFEFFEEGEASEEEIQKAYTDTLSRVENLETKNMLRNEEDRLGAVLKINAGAGGTESNDWAEMLFRCLLYTSFIGSSMAW